MPRDPQTYLLSPDHYRVGGPAHPMDFPAADDWAGATLPRDDPRHGRLSTYTNHSCRCASCRAAVRAYRAQRKQEGSAAALLGQAQPTTCRCHCPVTAHTATSEQGDLACTRCLCPKFRQRPDRTPRDAKPAGPNRNTQLRSLD